MEACCIFHNDTQWLIRGLKILSVMNKMNEKDKLLSVSLIANLQRASEEQLKIQINNTQVRVFYVFEDFICIFRSNLGPFYFKSLPCLNRSTMKRIGMTCLLPSPKLLLVTTSLSNK